MPDGQQRADGARGPLTPPRGDTRRAARSGVRGRGPRGPTSRALCLLTACLLAPLAVPRPSDAQTRSEYVLRAPSGETLRFSGERVKDMLERTRRLEQILEQDPDVLYYIGSGPAVQASRPGPAYPWAAVRVRSDSTAQVSVPGNYREGRRAYYNYAVKKMELVRSETPASSCATAVEREVELVSAFVDGWIVARTLYGGPAFAPLDALVFARDAGHLPAMLVDLGDSAIGGCLDRWRRQHPDRIAAYREWREGHFDAPRPAERAGDSVPAAADSLPGAPAPGDSLPAASDSVPSAAPVIPGGVPPAGVESRTPSRS